MLIYVLFTEYLQIESNYTEFSLPIGLHDQIGISVFKLYGFWYIWTLARILHVRRTLDVCFNKIILKYLPRDRLRRSMNHLGKTEVVTIESLCLSVFRGNTSRGIVGNTTWHAHLFSYRKGECPGGKMSYVDFFY